jgi:hypothetical protein
MPWPPATPTMRPQVSRRQSASPTFAPGFSRQPTGTSPPCTASRHVPRSLAPVRRGGAGGRGSGGVARRGFLPDSIGLYDAARYVRGDGQIRGRGSVRRENRESEVIPRRRRSQLLPRAHRPGDQRHFSRCSSRCNCPGSSGRVVQSGCYMVVANGFGRNFHGTQHQDWGFYLTNGFVNVKPETPQKPLGDVATSPTCHGARGGRSTLQGFQLGTPLPGRLPACGVAPKIPL